MEQVKDIHIEDLFVQVGSKSISASCCGNPVHAIGRSGRLAILSA
jgi:hypothetical protein